jgi:hypothetical protein
MAALRRQSNPRHCSVNQNKKKRSSDNALAKVVQPTVDRKQFKWVGVGWRHLEVAFLCILVCSCGGGSGPSSPPTTLSPDQQIYQQIELSGGESTLSWEFPFGGGPMVFGSDYIFVFVNDCVGTTTTADIDPCATGVTLAKKPALRLRVLRLKKA